MAIVHTPDTIKAQMQADIAASNAKTGATDTTLHDAVNRLIDGFGSGGGITPSGTLYISENGKKDVTLYAEVDVQVPTPDPICVSRQISIGADQGNGANSNLTVLSGDDFVKKHYSNENFSVTMIPLFTPVAENTVTSFIWHGNRKVITSKSSYYGLSSKSMGTGSHAQFNLLTAALNGTTYTAGFRAKNSGDLQLYTPSASIVKAGNYMLILTCN